MEQKATKSKVALAWRRNARCLPVDLGFRDAERLSDFQDPLPTFPAVVFRTPPSQSAYSELPTATAFPAPSHFSTQAARASSNGAGSPSQRRSPAAAGSAAFSPPGHQGTRGSATGSVAAGGGASSGGKILNDSGSAAATLSSASAQQQASRQTSSMAASSSAGLGVSRGNNGAQMVGLPQLGIQSSAAAAAAAAAAAVGAAASGRIGGGDGVLDGHFSVSTAALRLRSNRLNSLTGFAQLLTRMLLPSPTCLQWLDLSFNTFTTFDEALMECRGLTHLYLHSNMIEDICAVEKKLPLMPFAQQLLTLTLHGNPVVAHPECKAFVLRACPKLRHLDFGGVTRADRKTAFYITGQDSPDFRRTAAR